MLYSPIDTEKATSLPPWQRPQALLMLMAFAMPVSFFLWKALLNNFTIEMIGFDGSDIGWLHTVREIPGFLAVGVIALLVFFHEQFLAVFSLALLGVATALTAWFPSLYGILVITMLSSIGFHYFETINQSLQLQWIAKKDAPRIIARLVAIGAGAAAIAYILIILTWERFSLTYNMVYLAAGGFTAAMALFAWLAYPRFVSRRSQKNKIILKKRYWLYYSLQFLSGARRQIFVVFAAFMMVEHFGMSVDQMASLFLINLIVTTIFAPLIGRFIAHFGEKYALMGEYAGLVLVFAAYGGIYVYGFGVIFAAILFVIDNILFSVSMALKTYLQKIADPEDITPTSAVAFTINHISAVFLPALLGYLWLYQPAMVFFLAALIAFMSLCLAALIPHMPEKFNETLFSKRLQAY